MRLRPDLFSGIVPFVRTAEEQSFGRAAVTLGITTAAVSKAVRKLEEELGVKLLDRTSRSVSLTREGQLFLERCQRAVTDVQTARAALDGTQREPQGELAITLPPILAPLVVPQLARLGAQHPRLAFRLHVSDRVTRLADEGHDVAIRMGDLAPSSLIARLVRRTRWVTVASPGYLALRPAPLRPSDLASHDCLRFIAPNGKPRPWSFADGERAISLETTGSLVVDHGDSLLLAAEAGMGVCQVLDFMVDAGLRAGRLVEVLGTFAADGPPIHAVASAARARAANVRALIGFLADALRR